MVSTFFIATFNVGNKRYNKLLLPFGRKYASAEKCFEMFKSFEIHQVMPKNKVRMHGRQVSKVIKIEMG